MHLWLVEFSLDAQFELVRTMLINEGEALIEVSKELLGANHEVLVEIVKRLDEIKRQNKEKI